MTQSAAASNDDAWNGRVEDDALLRGQGRFGDDVKPDGTLAAYFVRSPHAFAKIVRINVAAAKSAPGVVAVSTATTSATPITIPSRTAIQFRGAAEKPRSHRIVRRLPKRG